ncbi:MAG: panB 2 [Firmicutes bacterium]|nr:panB 2 [Bacillota bacterium]
MAKTKITIPGILERKATGQKFKMITVYDYPMAGLVDRSAAEMILVGDSLGMVIQGLDGTVPVNMEDVLYHLKLVRRGAPNTFVVGDMPFLSYQVNKDDAIRNAGILLKAGADCVKMEGNMKIVDTVRAVVDAGIPVIGHIGLTPQTAAMMGGFKVQGKSSDAAEELLQTAIALDNAGVFAMVLECMPAGLCKLITERVKCATIGVGGGKYCDGQNLNAYDLIGVFDKFVPKFVKQYAQMGNQIVEVFDTWCKEIDEGTFPEDKHTFTMKDEDLKRLY